MDLRGIKLVTEDDEEITVQEILDLVFNANDTIDKIINEINGIKEEIKDIKLLLHCEDTAEDECEDEDTKEKEDCDEKETIFGKIFSDMLRDMLFKG